MGFVKAKQDLNKHLQQLSYKEKVIDSISIIPAINLEYSSIGRAFLIKCLEW